MNASSRLHQLLQFLEQDPNDAFTIYAVALEYRGTEPLRAKDYFDQLLEKFPEYLPTYYHAGALYFELGHKEKAEEIYKMGMDLARKTSRSKDFRELQNAYNQLLYPDNE